MIFNRFAQQNTHHRQRQDYCCTNYNGILIYIRCTTANGNIICPSWSTQRFEERSMNVVSEWTNEDATRYARMTRHIALCKLIWSSSFKFESYQISAFFHVPLSPLRLYTDYEWCISIERLGRVFVDTSPSEAPSKGRERGLNGAIEG